MLHLNYENGYNLISLDVEVALVVIVFAKQVWKFLFEDQVLQSYYLWLGRANTLNPHRAPVVRIYLHRYLHEKT